MHQTLDPRRAILLTFVVFCVQPFARGAWLAMIPFIKASLGLSKTELALTLLAMPLALIPTLQIASRVIARFGPRRVFAILLPVHGLAACGPFLATGQGTLFVALAAFGAMGAFMQVCLNVYAGRLEKQLDRLVMSRCHGFWALGLAMGSALAGLLAGSNPIWAVLGIAVISTIPGVIAARALPHLAGSEAAVTGKSSKRRINQIPLRLYAISGFAFSISMTEGAMADWAAVYLAERLPVGATYAGIAVTVYGTSLAAGRFVGDSLKRQLGAVGLARLTVGLAISGVLVLIMPLPLMFAYVGFVLIGLGASVGFPLGVSAVAALDDQFEAQNIALMSMLVICGFLIGPPLIGILGDVFTLRVGLAALIPGLVVSFVLSKQLQSQ
jgi:MFS family permease